MSVHSETIQFMRGWSSFKLFLFFVRCALQRNQLCELFPDTVALYDCILSSFPLNPYYILLFVVIKYSLKKSQLSKGDERSLLLLFVSYDLSAIRR